MKKYFVVISALLASIVEEQVLCHQECLFHTSWTRGLLFVHAHWYFQTSFQSRTLQVQKVLLYFSCRLMQQCIHSDQCSWRTEVKDCMHRRSSLRRVGLTVEWAVCIPFRRAGYDINVYWKHRIESDYSVNISNL